MSLATSRAASARMARLYFPLFACGLAILTLSGAGWLLPLFVFFTYLVVMLGVTTVTRLWHDRLNPLLLISLIAFIRFSIPGFLSLGTEPDVVIFEVMRLEREAWLLGHALALAGLAGVVLGWLIPSEFSCAGCLPTGFLSFRSSQGVSYAALLAMLTGIVALVVFVGSHASILDAVTSGEMRSTEIRTGTGKYFYLALILISGSVVFSAHLVAKRFNWWAIYLPAVVAATCFWVLGGRSRALVPIACTTLILWYARHQVHVPWKGIVIAAALGLPVFSFVGELYRAGLGTEAFAHVFSLSLLREYISYAVWLEWGQLHSLAGAISIGPGVLGGQTFTNLLWPLSQFLNLPAKSAGLFIVQNLLGESDHKWAFHATLIGDAYLNFGIIGVVMVTAIFGILLNKLYTSFRSGHLAAPYYALITVYALRIFFESVEKFGEALVVFAFAFGVIWVGRSVLGLRGVQASERASQDVRTLRWRYRNSPQGLT